MRLYLNSNHGANTFRTIVHKVLAFFNAKKLIDTSRLKYIISIRHREHIGAPWRVVFSFIVIYQVDMGEDM